MPLLRVPIRCYGFSLGKVKESCLRAWEVGLPVKRRTQLRTAPLPSVKDHWVPPPFFPNLLLLFSFHPPFSPLPTDSEAWMLCHRAVVQRTARRGRGQGQGAL